MLLLLITLQKKYIVLIAAVGQKVFLNEKKANLKTLY